MALRLLSTVFLLLSMPAFAGVVFEFELHDTSDPAAEPDRINTSVEGERIRMDVKGPRGANADMIFRGDRREVGGPAIRSFAASGGRPARPPQRLAEQREPPAGQALDGRADASRPVGVGEVANDLGTRRVGDDRGRELRESDPPGDREAELDDEFSRLPAHDRCRENRCPATQIPSGGKLPQQNQNLLRRFSVDPLVIVHLQNADTVILIVAAHPEAYPELVVVVA